MCSARFANDIARAYLRSMLGSLILIAAIMEVLMRILALAILTIAAILTAPPARAQTYGGAFPVCLQTYGIGGNYIDCSYTSLAQCNASASGRAAQCVINPYFASAQVPGGYWRHRRAY